MGRLFVVCARGHGRVGRCGMDGGVGDAGGPVTSVEASVAEKPRPRAYGQGLRYVLILYVKDSSSGRQARVPAENYGVATVGQAYTWNCYETPLFKRWRCAMAPGSPP